MRYFIRLSLVCAAICALWSALPARGADVDELLRLRSAPAVSLPEQTQAAEQAAPEQPGVLLAYG